MVCIVSSRSSHDAMIASLQIQIYFDYSAVSFNLAGGTLLSLDDFNLENSWIFQKAMITYQRAIGSLDISHMYICTCMIMYVHRTYFKPDNNIYIYILLSRNPELPPNRNTWSPRPTEHGQCESKHINPCGKIQKDMWKTMKNVRCLPREMICK